MKKKLKVLCRILSVFLAILLVFEAVPMQVAAETAEAVKTVAESNTADTEEIRSAEDEVLDESGNVKILCEDETKREEYVKHFRMSDGTYQAVVYEMPVHMEKDGEWVDYDNSLSRVASDETRFARGILNKDLINTFGDYTVRFSEKTNMSKLVRLTKDGYDLSWSFSDSNKRNAKVVENEDDGDETTLENLTSQVIYENIYDGADLQYVVMPEQLKENIILKDGSAPSKFYVEYCAEGLVPVFVDGETVILQNANGDAVFTLYAPVMYDAFGETSEGITLAVSDVTENGFTVTMSLDEQWLGSADRQFPVTVDPAIKTEQDRSEMTSTFVASGYPDKAFGSSSDDAGSMYVGNGIANYGKAKTYIKINNLPSIGEKTSKVIGAQLAVCKRNVYSTTNNVTVYAHQVTSSWSKSGLTYNNQPSYDGNVADYTVLTADNKTQNDYHDIYIYPEFKSFDITKLVYAWYEGTAANYGIMLESEQSNVHKAWFHSIEYPTYPTTRPVLSVAYRNMSGVEDYWSFTSLAAGRNGTASVNNYNGNFVFTQPLTQDLGGNLMPVNISLVYNSNTDSENTADMGGGVQTNYHIRLVRENDKMRSNGYKYYLIDADGTKHWFYFEDGADSGKDEDGLDYTLAYIDGKNDPQCPKAVFRITDKDKNKMFFDGSLRLIQCTNANGISSKVTYALYGSQYLLASVTDGAGRVYRFHYDYINGGSTYYLIKIEDPVGRFTKFEYENNRITKIIFPDDNGNNRVLLDWNYGSSSVLNKITDIDGNRVNIEYDWTSAFRVKSFSYGDFSGNLPSRYQFAYYPNETTVQSQHAIGGNVTTDNTYTYQFNNYGQNIGIVSHDDGEAQYFDYRNSNGTNSKTSQTNNKLVSQSKVIKSVTNLLCNQGFRDGLLYYTPVKSDNTSITVNSSRGYLDGKAVVFAKTSTEKSDCLVVRDCSSLAPGNYTFSGYISTDGKELSGNGTYIGVKKTPSNGSAPVYVQAENVKKTDGWQRFTVSFSVNSGDSVRLFFGFSPEASGTFLVDNLQLKTGMGASSYNLIQNNDAVSGTYAWTSTGNLSVESGVSEFKNSLSVGGSTADSVRGIQQTITVAGEKGDVYSIGAWLSARSVPTTSGIKPKDPKFGVALHFYNAAGQKVGVREIDANPEVPSWQFVSGKAVAPENYSYVCFETYYYNNANRVYTTGAFCYKEEFGQTYTYDNNGNIVSSEDLSKSNSTFGYQGNNLSGMLNPSGSSYLYSYDNSNNLRTAFSSDGLKYYLEYDNKGNLTQTVTKGVSVTQNEIDTTKKYAIVNQLTSYALGKGDKNYAVNQMYLNSSSLQQWEFERVGNGIYKIKLNDDYLYVEDGSSSEGAKLKLRSQNTDSYAFKFVVVQTGDGAFVISTVASQGNNYYLDSTDGKNYSADENSIITQRTLRTPKNTSQKWYLIEDYSDNNNTKRMYSSAEYTENGNYLKSQTDQAGNTTEYNYNTASGTLSSVTNAAGNTTTYGYNSNNNSLTSVSAGGITNEYSYNNDRLTEISVNNSTKYSFGYDKFGRTVSTSVGNGNDFVPLSTLEYNQKSLLTMQSYGNGDCINFVYDSLDRMTEKSYNNGISKKKYIYGNDGNISLTVDYATNSYTRYNYDLSGRTASVREYSGTDISSNTPISYTEYGYADKTNYLTNVKHFSMLGTQNIAYKYGNVAIGEMPDQVYSVSWNGKTKVTNGYDSLSRLSTRKINGLATNYTYKDISADKTTTLVKSVETSGIKHEYEYDALGNITSIYDGSRTTTYEYDELNQLTRVNDPYENKTHIYSYLNGNITSDKVYAYTTDNTPANLQYTVKYFYENSVWADVLTGVQTVYPENGVNTLSLEQENIPENVTKLLGNNAVRYDMSSRLSGNNGIAVLNDNEDVSVVTSDTIGNITSYNGSTYTWLGRQLQSVSNDEMTTTFSYNSDGQRIGKKISISGDSEYDYSYYYNGDILAGYKLVISDSNGSSSLHTVTFMYDENGDAFGFNYNGNDYYYVRNAQNDVVFITDSANNGVVMYQYDAWGNITACYDTSDDGMLSIINPYTYRGYYYEIDTATYFLKSRYYNPELCRFISADSVLDNRATNTLNQFAYCANNPIGNADDGGRFFVGAIIGGIIGGAFGALNAAMSGKSVKAGLVTGAVSGAIMGLACDIAATGVISLGLCVAVCGSVSLMANVVNQYCNYIKDKNNAKRQKSHTANSQGKYNKNSTKASGSEKRKSTRNFASYIDYKSVAISTVSAMAFAPLSVAGGVVVNSSLSGLETCSGYMTSQFIAGFAVGGNISTLQGIAELFIGEVLQ